MTYTPTIGLEVHAELKTKSKMFCGCKNDPHDSEANTHICPVCMAHPGTLPVPNETAIEMVLMFGQAVGAKAATYSEFDRKNYFYPDIPKAYQISQYAYPFLSGGKLEEVELTRVHLEEDTARSQHDKGEESLVDFNRAGVPLMELVTEPVIHDAETAGKFARELQLLLRTLGISDANMERGEMRVEANISVSADTTKFGTKVEVKNLNSFKAVESAIKYEIVRQIELLEKGGVVTQETRGWDENRSKTFTQRTKETAKDYRYFPDPDISKMNVSTHASFNHARLSEKMPKLPEVKRVEYSNLGLPSEQVEVIISQVTLDNFFAELISVSASSVQEVKLSANYLTSDIQSLIQTGEYLLTSLRVEHFCELMRMLVEDKLSSRAAKDILPKLFDSAVGPEEIASQSGLLQLSDPASFASVIKEVIDEQQTVVAEYRSGKEAALQFLLGQCMKKTKGAANPNILKNAMLEALK
ncbi:MAG: Asp-tRNA(Asn)/Glu-tRNA(Gln) amidotransferase subunit GatB [Candidatus Pacebacteria bacterium]|nr:Asp-tRNA(Asn)/Glu-tRNA(Gln) amidotransferase subunit GatB [Candidatus Paceibacterota bacterium]